jgi:hypothetical protein
MDRFFAVTGRFWQQICFEKLSTSISDAGRTMVKTQDYSLIAEAKNLTNCGISVIPLRDKIPIIEYKH